MPGGGRRHEQPGPRAAPLFLRIGLLVLVGVPMVYVLWEAVNHLLSGEIGAVRWAIVGPVVLVFSAYVWWLSRIVIRWDRETR